MVRNEEGERRLSMLRWGLIPAWAKDPGIGHKLINARAETAAVKSAFRAALSKRRCLVPVDGYYEWRREGSVRQPWLIARRDGGPMAFAGLWERWRVPEGAVLRGSLAERRPGDVVETFTILTCDADLRPCVRCTTGCRWSLPEDAFELLAHGRGCSARTAARGLARDAPGRSPGQQPSQRRPRVRGGAWNRLAAWTVESASTVARIAGTR